MDWLSYQAYRLLRDCWRRLERRLTPTGWLVLVGLGLCGALGVDPDQAVAGQAFALLLCLFVVARVWVARFPGRFSAQRRVPRFGTVGQPLTYAVEVRNHTARLWRELELLEEATDPWPTWPQFKAALASSRWHRSFRLSRGWPTGLGRTVARLRPVRLGLVPSHGCVEVQVELVPLRRGPLRLAATLVARRDPLGLIRGWVRLPQPQTILILPKRYVLPPLALPGRLQYQQGGVVFASSVGESEEFVSLRHYRAGDPIRHVHWRSSARVGRLVVKEFEDEFFVRHALVLDTFAEPDQAEAFEEAVSLAASLVCAVQTQESLLDLMFVGPEAVCLTTGRGVGHVERALEILAAVEPCRDKPFAALQWLVLQHAHSLSGCVCILLDWDAARQELVRRLRALGLPLWVWVVTDAPTAARIVAQPEPDRPRQFLVLEVGQIEAGLRKLHSAELALNAAA